MAWVIASQMIGFGLSGLFRDFLVHPPSMIWPHVLPEVALYNSFHHQHTQVGDDGASPITAPLIDRMSRMGWFWSVFGFIFIYQWVNLQSLLLVATIFCTRPTDSVHTLFDVIQSDD